MYTTFRINSTKNCRNLTGFRRISTEIPLALTAVYNNIQKKKDYMCEKTMVDKVDCKS